MNFSGKTEYGCAQNGLKRFFFLILDLGSPDDCLEKKNCFPFTPWFPYISRIIYPWLERFWKQFLMGQKSDLHSIILWRSHKSAMERNHVLWLYNFYLLLPNLTIYRKSFVHETYETELIRYTNVVRKNMNL